MPRKAAAALTGASAGSRDAALLLAQWALARPSVYGLPLSVPFLRLGETIYRAPTPPGAPSAFALGTLTRTLRLISAEAEHRRANAAWLLARIPERGPISAPRPAIGSEPGYLRLPVIVAAAARPHFPTDRARFLGVWPGYPRALSELEGLDPAGRIGKARLPARRLWRADSSPCRPIPS